MRKLAILGGEPLFATPLCVGKPNLVSTEKIQANVASVLNSLWLTNDGPWVHKLERQLCEHLHVEHCIAVANGTLGLEIAARALIPLGKEVIVPSFTFIATPHALSWQGYKPVFAEINAMSHVLDPKDVEAKITPQTGGILGVHLWGTPCAVPALTAIAARNNIPLIFDAAHAFCCDYDWRTIGNFGACEVFSFHATKFYNTVEGGAITTNDSQLAQVLREMRNFGFVGDNSHHVTHVGINAKMSEIHAAIGVANLVGVTDTLMHNVANHLDYSARLKHGNIRVYPHHGISNHQYIVIELLSKEFSADILEQVLHAENIFARRYFSPPCHQMLPYNEESCSLSVTEALAERVLVLPSGMAVKTAEIDKICQVVLYYMEHSTEIALQLAKE